MRRARLALVIALVSTGCVPVGRHFVRPTPTTFQIGQSSLEDVRKQLGEPSSQRMWSRNDNVLTAPPTALPTLFGSAVVSGAMRELTYTYVWRLGETVRPGVEPGKSLRVWFWNDKLVGYRASSSFREDSTDFDESKAASLRPWKSLRHEVVELLGPPSGMAGYPLTRYEDQQILIYSGFEWDTSKREVRSKNLYVLVDALGVVEDARFEGTSRPMPPPAVTPGTTTVPVYVPPPSHKSR
jgi:hypothetical protein